MNQKLSISIKNFVYGWTILLALSGQAMATADSAPVPFSLFYGNTFSTSQKHDDFLFSIPVTSFNSISSTINLGSYWGINNLQAMLQNETVTVIDPITLDIGSYAGIRNLSDVSEEAEWALLLPGFVLLGYFAARRRRIKRMIPGHQRKGAKVINAYIHALSWNETLTRIANWAKARESRYVCLCNVHSVVLTTKDEEFNRVVSQADLAMPDGMPVAWMLHQQGFFGQERINGPDLMWKYCTHAEHIGEAVYFFGNTSETLQRLSEKMGEAFPKLRVGGMYSPPFGETSEAEDAEIVASINASGASVVFVSLGCPKQEKWMAAHRHRIHAVMIGVGAAFDFHAGTIRRAPLWMQRSGVEWLHRLCSEPKRLWKRYLVTNTIFIFGAFRQLMLEPVNN